MTIVGWCAAIGSIILVSAIHVQADAPVIDQRQANQEQRIDRGLASGQLTGSEAERLNNQQEHINPMENKSKSDGVMTKKERAKLRAAQDRTSRHIARQKHDRQGTRRP